MSTMQKSVLYGDNIQAVNLSGWRQRFQWLNVRPWQVAVVIILGVASAAAEGSGMAMMLPVLEFMSQGQDIERMTVEAQRWQWIAAIYAKLHLPVTLFSLMAPVFLLGLFRQAFTYGRQLFSAHLQFRVTAHIQSKAFAAFARSDLAFSSASGSGRLINAVTADGQRAGTAMQFFFDLLAVQALLACYIILLIATAGWMVFAAGGIMLLIWASVRSLLKRSIAHGRMLSELNAQLQRSLVELLSGLKLVKLADREGHAVNSVHRILQSLCDNSIMITRLAGRTRLLVEPIAMLALFAVLFLAVEMLALSLERIILLAVVVIRLVPLGRSVLDTRQALYSYLPSFESVYGLIQQAEAQRTIRDGDKVYPGLERMLVFEQVSFRYPSATYDALQEVDLVIPAKRMTALVGHSGAGKSTLVDLIPRLIQPTSGRVLSDGVPLEAFTLASLRRQTAFVPQEGFAFDDTVANNIRYAKPEASLDEVVVAARAAHAHEFIEQMPQGYDTLVGERGTRLSIGQRQRLTLARALLQRASILILDEPTSALDSETEQGVQESLERLRSEGKTTIIVIAHRLSTVYHADQIVVLDFGRVLECGTHRQLMHNDEWYARILGLQQAPVLAATSKGQ
jgi:ABC-type multidrug transport system fused ATPase/permease subunit